jgi:hypothetical protein
MPILNHSANNEVKARYFRFEEDFILDGLRCIPIIVRFKLDKVGIKLPLADWCRFNESERVYLADLPVDRTREQEVYREYLLGLLSRYSGAEPRLLAVEKEPAWEQDSVLPRILIDMALAQGWEINLEQWKSLDLLQRFALLKLCRPGHENRNFPRAMEEFGLKKRNG